MSFLVTDWMLDPGEGGWQQCVRALPDAARLKVSVCDCSPYHRLACKHCKAFDRYVEDLIKHIEKAKAS